MSMGSQLIEATFRARKKFKNANSTLHKFYELATASLENLIEFTKKGVSPSKTL